MYECSCFNCDTCDRLVHFEGAWCSLCADDECFAVENLVDQEKDNDYFAV